MKTNQARESHEPRLLGTDFLAPGIVPVDGYVAFDATGGITKWNIDGNDSESDCGFAMDDHANMAQLGDATLVGQLFMPEFAGVLAAYWQYGVDNGETGVPNPLEPDFGVSNATMMAWLYKHGFIKGYLEVPLTQLDWWAGQFTGACVGMTLNSNTCFREFEAVPKSPWGSDPADLSNNTSGHDAFYAKSGGDGTGWLVTWGELMPFAEAFRANMTDAWVIITRNMDWVNQEKLDAVLTEMHGTVTPYVAPVATLSSWASAKTELKKLESWTNDREALHKLAVSAVENESVNLLAGELGALVLRLGAL